MNKHHSYTSSDNKFKKLAKVSINYLKTKEKYTMSQAQNTQDVSDALLQNL